MERVSNERLQAMLDYANKRAQEEDCVRRLENWELVSTLDNARRISILSTWCGGQNPRGI